MEFKINDRKASIKCSNDMNDTYKNFDEYNPNKNAKYWPYLTVFDFWDA